jgi:hypothetical protein
VPVLDFSTLGFVAPMTTNGNTHTPSADSVFGYFGPSQALQRIAVAVGAQGVVLPIRPPSTNASWTSSFYGPALRCNPIVGSEQMEIHQNIADYLREDNRCFGPSAYLTWFGKLPYALPPGDTILENTNDTLILPEDKNLEFRVSVLPNMIAVIPTSTHRSHPACSFDTPMVVHPSYANGTTLQCSLYNSS